MSETTTKVSEQLFKIDREGPMLYISHPRWSLVGCGDTLAAAGKDFEDDATDMYAMFVGRTDLSDSAKEMVAWLEETYQPPRGAQHRRRGGWKYSAPMTSLRASAHPTSGCR